jgi:malate dehydrogenase
MATVQPIRVAISGAAGRIAYSLVFRISAGGLFGRDQPVALSLVELTDALPRLRACELELKDCASHVLPELECGTDPYSGFAGADWIILLGGSPIRPDVRNRFELLRANAPIMVEHGRAINQVAPTARVLVVTAPSNTNCMVARSQAPHTPPEHWFALNQVIRMRAISLIAEKVGVPASQVSRVAIWGNNSESAFIDLHCARIGERPALEAINDEDWVNHVLRASIADRAQEIFQLSGIMPAGSIAQAILTTIRSIVTPTPFDHWFTAAVVSDGSYGVPRGLVFGFPLVTPDGKTWSIVDGCYLSEAGCQSIMANVVEIQHEASAVSDLLGAI